MKKLSVLVCLALVWMAGTSAGADCGQLVINAYDRGWYDAGGYHDPSNDNYYCGDGSNVGTDRVPLRNWFAFTVPPLTQQIVSAFLRVQTFEVASPTGSEIYELHHVSTAISTLRAGGTGLTSIYADLGDGPVYGSRVFFTNESYQTISIPLNSTFISNLVAAGNSTNSSLALGGVISTLDGISGNDEHVFSYSFGNSTSVQLVLNFSDTSPLAILTQPQSQTVNAGDNVVFSVQACGVTEPSYQWQLNGTNLPVAANNSFFSLVNVSSNAAGAYRVIVSNSSGSLTSAVATLTVLYQAPTATAYVYSANSPLYSGSTVQLCASIAGIPFPNLQWQFNGTNLLYQNGDCLVLYNVQTNQSGNYRIIASNAVGVVTSAVVSVTVTPAPPVYVYFPYSPSPIAVGLDAYLCAAVNLDPFPSLQWRFNGTNLVGQTNQCLYLGRVDTNNAGPYTVVATNISGTYTSPPVELTTYYALPLVSGAYFTVGSPNLLVGNDVTMCPGIYSGSPPLTFRWRFNGVELPGNDTSCLSLFGVTTNQAGDYSVVVSNVAGSVTSFVATLTVSYQPPIFSYQPFSQTVVEGSTVRITAYAAAGPPATHVLQLNGTNLAVPFSYSYYGNFGSDAGGFTLLDVTPADSGDYRVIATNSLGSATSLVATLTVAAAGPLDRWTQRNPLPQSQPLYSVANGPGLFVGVGDHGTILTSTDGTNWFLQSRRADVTLFGVAYGGGLYAAVGAGGTILVSADGTNWAYRYSAPALELHGVTYGQGRFVATGTGPSQTILLLSADGVTWDKVSVPNVAADQNIAFGNDTFVAVGHGQIIASGNGLDWTVTRSTLAAELESVSFVQGQFIAVGNLGYMLVSSDGVSWGARNSGTTRRLLGVAYGNGRFVAVGVRGMIMTSTDASTWGPATSGTADRLETVNFGNGLFTAAGENGTIIISTNGTDWAKENYGPTRDLDGMALANGLIVIVGKAGSIITSSDGIHYTERNASVTNDLHGVAWGHGLWVAVGEPGIILTSSNAIQWAKQTTGDTNSLKAATYGNGKWVVVGTQGALLTSDDGTNWSRISTSPAFDLNDVAYGNGVFVVAGDGFFNQNGSCFISTNGLSWAWNNSINFSKNLRGLLFTNGIFFAPANDGYFFTSTNGLIWNGYYCGFYQNLRGVTRAEGLWMMVGNRGTILTSDNLLTWVARPTRTFENLHEVVYLDGRFVTMGNRGTVLQSGRSFTELEPPRFQPGTGAIVEIKGVYNTVYRLQASGNLSLWTNIFRFTNTSDQVFFTDSNAVSLPRRFYRVVTE